MAKSSLPLLDLDFSYSPAEGAAIAESPDPAVQILAGSQSRLAETIEEQLDRVWRAVRDPERIEIEGEKLITYVKETNTNLGYLPDAYPMPSVEFIGGYTDDLDTTNFLSALYATGTLSGTLTADGEAYLDATTSAGDKNIFCGRAGGAFLPSDGDFTVECAVTNIVNGGGNMTAGICLHPATLANGVDWDGGDDNVFLEVFFTDSGDGVTLVKKSNGVPATIATLTGLPTRAAPKYLRIVHSYTGTTHTFQFYVKEGAGSWSLEDTDTVTDATWARWASGTLDAGLFSRCATRSQVKFEYIKFTYTPRSVSTMKAFIPLSTVTIGKTKYDKNYCYLLETGATTHRGVAPWDMPRPWYVMAYGSLWYYDNENDGWYKWGLPHYDLYGITANDHHDQLHYHDGETLQFDGVNSDGGAFSFTTSDKVTFNQPVGVQYLDLTEISPPAAPAGASNILRLYTEAIQGFSFFSFVDDTGMRRKLVRDSVILVYNNTGSPIAVNRVVYAVGNVGNVPSVALAQSNSSSTMPAIGVTIEEIAHTAYGRVMQVGLLENLDTSTLSAGDVLYVHDTVAGAVRITQPSPPALIQEVGTVLASDASDGAVQVVARGTSGDEQGTNQNTFSLGDGLAGTKTLTFNAVTDASIAWDETKFDFGTAPLLTTGTLGAGATTLSGTLDMAGNDIDNIDQMWGDATYLRVGAGATSHAAILTDHDDMLVSGNLEVDGRIHADAGIWQDAATAGTASIQWTEAGSARGGIWADYARDQFLFGAAATLGRQFVFIQTGYSAQDYDHATQANPTIFIHSAIPPDTDNTQWISFAHLQTYALITTGVGDIRFGTGLDMDSNIFSQYLLTTTRILVGASPYTALATDDVIYCDTDGGAITVLLPAGVDGKRYKIVNCGTSGNDVTITPNGAELLNGVNANAILIDGENLDATYETTEGWY